MPHILLLGAGFSRNWGGWLADEAFEYLLGSPTLDDRIRSLLWEHKRLGGFEVTLAQLQEEFDERRDMDSEVQLAKLEGAVIQMFLDMNEAFLLRDNFEFGNNAANSVCAFLSEFDAIFTLNQDLLLERHYLSENLALFLHATNRSGWQIPGMRPMEPQSGSRPDEMNWSPMDESEFAVDTKLQPYFKLHGSSNWFAESSSKRPLLIMGGNKASAIERFRILKWNHARFREYLGQPKTRLMIIGYSFGDEHINFAIRDAVEAGTLRVFIIDPLGVDVLRREHLWIRRDYLGDRLQPHLIGASRRTLREIFGGDPVEHGKVMRFFA